MTINTKKLALSRFLEEPYSEISQGYNDDYFEYGSQEYLVVTDSEADNYWNDELDNYIDDCVLHELPEQYHPYFDREQFKSDCEIDGRGHTLAHYDGEEHEIESYDGKNNTEYFYIYRVN